MVTSSPRSFRRLAVHRLPLKMQNQIRRTPIQEKPLPSPHLFWPDCPALSRNPYSWT